MNRLLSVFFIFGIVAMASCKKAEPPVDDDNNNDSIPQKALVFDSLSSVPVLHLDETTEIHAYADGDELTFTWTIDLGTILGNGNQVTFTACCSGNHKLSCTVTDKYGATLSKSLIIQVI